MLQPEAGVVDQEVDRPGLVEEPVLDQGHSRPLAEVGDQHLALGAVTPLQLLGQALQPLAVAGHEHEVMSALGQPECQDATDPGGRAGDEGNGSSRGRRHVVSQPAIAHASQPGPA